MKKILLREGRPRLKSGLFIFFLILSATCAFSQPNQVRTTDKPLSGAIVDFSTGEALSKVNIENSGNARSVLSGSSGEFTIPASPGDTLLFSHIGFQTQRVVVRNYSSLIVRLEQGATQELEDVVVVGYGTIKKSDLTGAVVALREKDFNQGPVTAVEDLISGKAAGVQIVQNTGEPGGGMSVNIRGVGSITGGTSPLYVIDGLPIDNSVLISGTGNEVTPNRSPRNPLSSLNPRDIQSIEILKDASATAIYGSRGANGVIIVTTKSGAAGALKIGYSGNIGIQNVHQRLDLLNPQQYMAGVNALIDAGQGTEAERVTGIQNGGTDWQDVVFHENAMTQSHNLSMSWGNSSTNYLVALNHIDQEGLVENSGYKRYGARFNLRHTSDKFKFGISSNMSFVDDQMAPFGFDIASRGGAINAAKVSDPTLAVRDANGEYVLSEFMSLDNAAAIINGTRMEGNRYRFFGTAYGEYFVLPSLSVKVNVGGDVNNENRVIYKDRTTLSGRDLGGVGTAYEGTQTNYLIEGMLNYNKSINDHKITAVAGATTQKFLRRTSQIEGSNFVTDATYAYNFSLADPATITARSGKSTNQLLSYLGRLNYTYRDKYLLTATYRIDGSSRFGTSNRFGYFPSLSIGWRIDQEKFFEPLTDVFSTFKLRTSWGRTGNQEIGNNQYLVTFASGARTSYVLDDQFVISLNPTRIDNPDLKWETTEQTNIGLDFAIMNGRISGSVDWYRKNTYDMLIDLPVPTSSGFDSKLVNIGRMNNTGLEFMINSNNIATKNFSWTSSINLSTLKNNVRDLGGVNRILQGSMSQHTNIGIITPGAPILSFYGYEVTGVWQQTEADKAADFGAEPGDFKFRDINNDGVISTDDRMILGNSFPDVSWALGNSFNYKSFELYIFFQGVTGVQMLNGNLLETYLPRGDNVRSNRMAKPFLDRWTPSNPTNEQPSFVGVRQFSQSINTKTVTDASWVKLQTVRLSYNLPRKLTGKVFKSATVYATGQNLITFSDYQGFDPALNPNGDANFRIDWNGYPSATTYLVGLDLNF